MWGIAFSWDLRAWRLGKCDARDDDGRLVGTWWCLGPVAICYDFE